MGSTRWERRSLVVEVERVELLNKLGYGQEARPQGGRVRQRVQGSPYQPPPLLLGGLPWETSSEGAPVEQQLEQMWGKMWGQAAGAGHLKTKLCTRFASGFCNKGEFCTFAHGEEEVGTPQPDPEMVMMFKDMDMMNEAAGAGGKGGGGGGGGQQPWQAQQPQQPWQAQPGGGGGGGGGGFKKTKLCTNFEQGFCPRGDMCTFAHGEQELGTLQPAGGAGKGGGGAQPGRPFMKTKLCHHWQQQGSCSRGESCGFAHGEHEIGTPQTGGGGCSGGAPAGKGGPTQAEKELFNFKTTLCNNFANDGTCPRGDRCAFAHGEGELMEPGQAKAVVEQMEMGEQGAGMTGAGMESFGAESFGAESFGAFP